MAKLTHNQRRTVARINRVRSHIVGTSERPRLSVHISLKHVSAQVIDDSKHHTLASYNTAANKSAKGTLTEKAILAGSEIAKTAKLSKVKRVVFDRGGKAYHGRVKALADAARNEGLEF